MLERNDLWTSKMNEKFILQNLYLKFIGTSFVEVLFLFNQGRRWINDSISTSNIGDTEATRSHCWVFEFWWKLKNRKGTIRSEFPGEYYDKTLNEIEKDAKAGNARTRTAKKLLNDNRFKKWTNNLGR